MSRMSLSSLPVARQELPEPIFDAEVVQLRLEDAGAVLLALPGRGCFPAGFRTAWPADVVRAAEAAPFREEDVPIAPPSARRIDQMDQAFAWLSLMPADKAQHRKIVFLRSLTNPRHGRRLNSFRKIGRMFDIDHHTAQSRYAQGIGWITQELYRQQLQGSPWAMEWQRLRQVAGSLNLKQLVPDAPPPPAAPPIRAMHADERPIVVADPAARAMRLTNYVESLTARSRGALGHFPADGSPRSLLGGRGFGEREVIALEMSGMLEGGPSAGLYQLTPDGQLAQGLLGRA